MFKIKFKTLEDAKLLKSISLEQFKHEYSYNIRGFLLLSFNDKTFGFLDEDESCNGDDIFAELLVTWFSFLNEVVRKLVIESHTYVAVKYVEDASTWFEFKVNERNLLTVSLIEVQPVLGPSSVIVYTPFDKYTYGNWRNVEILLDEFASEVIDKTKQFISAVKNINLILLESDSLQKLIQYVNNYDSFAQ